MDVLVDWAELDSAKFQITDGMLQRLVDVVVHRVHRRESNQFFRMGLNIIRDVFVGTDYAAMKRAHSKHNGFIDLFHAFPVTAGRHMQPNRFATGPGIGLRGKFLGDMPWILAVSYTHLRAHET